MIITMLVTQSGSRDGVKVERFTEGATYDLGGTALARDLAGVFVREGWAAEKPQEQSAAPEPEAPPKPQEQAGRRKP